MWALGGLLVEGLLVGLQAIQLWLKKKESERWPSTYGRVLDSQLRCKTGFLARGRCHCVFRYTFPVHESRYDGVFAFEPEDKETAETLQKQVAGTEVTVRYDPNDPRRSLIENEWICGRKVTQNPHWLP